MSDLRFEQLILPGADLGPENPLPDLMPVCSDPPGILSDVPAGDGLNLGYGDVRGILPYKIQDGYNRSKEEKAYRAAVLENDRLKATFLLDYGGRLWSLVYKPEGRELLYRNPVFQPANLALRNAWFAGGVEWNIGMAGHSPFTCSPLHAEKLEDDDGTPVLRLYEWERIRQAVYRMEFYLPDGSDFLFARMKITNCRNETVPMYWWSNMAAPEKPDVRVVVPAEQAYCNDYGQTISKIEIPLVRGADVSYSTNINKPVDYFFRVTGRPWVAAIDGEGRGVVQASTKLLKGRKLFAWGMGMGGRHWQRYLSDSVFPYIEIQAGLAYTQMECLPMPARAEWEWLEAYGPIQADAQAAHSDQWHDAISDVDSRLDKRLSAQWLEDELERTRDSISRKMGAPVSGGSGWGALESLRRRRAGLEPMSPLAGFAKECLGEEQKPWAALLCGDGLPYASPLDAPVSYMIQQEWKELLETALEAGKGDHWLSWLHVGVMRFAQKDMPGAEAAWKRSLALEPSPWALRNLSVLRAALKDYAGAADLMQEAYGMLPGEASLLKELLAALTKAGRPQCAIELYTNLPQERKESGRIKLLYAQALLAAGRLEDCEGMLNEPFEVFDLREGEYSLTDLWFRLQERLLAQRENTEVTESVRRRVAETSFPPPWMDFR